MASGVDLVATAGATPAKINYEEKRKEVSSLTQTPIYCMTVSTLPTSGNIFANIAFRQECTAARRTATRSLYFSSISDLF